MANYIKKLNQKWKKRMINIKKYSKMNIEKHKKEFVITIYNTSLYFEAKDGIPAAITTAQACIESRYGEAVPKDTKKGIYSYNLFGVKNLHKKGKYVMSWTHEYKNGKSIKSKEPFKVYKDYYSSIEDHAKILKKYRPSSKSINAWANSLQKKGYATDPHYAKNIKNVISYWRLK